MQRLLLCPPHIRQGYAAAAIALPHNRRYTVRVDFLSPLFARVSFGAAANHSRVVPADQGLFVWDQYARK
jgi:hypothetical protein